MRWYYWLLLIVLLAIAIDTLIKIYVNYKARKARKMIRTLLDSSNIKVSEYPLLPEDSYIAGFDPYYPYGMFSEKTKPMVEVYKKDGIIVSLPKDKAEEMLTKPTSLYSEEEIQKRQLVGSLVESIRIKKQVEVVGIREQLKEGEYKHTYDVAKAFPPEKLDKVITEEFSKRVDHPHIKEYQNIPKEFLEDFKDPDIPKKEETPEDYLKNIVFVNGKWTKKASK